MYIKDLTPEQLERARECTTTEELIELAEEVGIDLTDEQIDAISGGAIWDWSCPLDDLLPD